MVDLRVILLRGSVRMFCMASGVTNYFFESAINYFLRVLNGSLLEGYDRQLQPRTTELG